MRDAAGSCARLNKHGFQANAKREREEWERIAAELSWTDRLHNWPASIEMMNVRHAPQQSIMNLLSLDELLFDRYWDQMNDVRISISYV